MNIDNLDIKKSFYNSLNERQKRHFLALEAKILGYGGIKAVSQTFGVSKNTVQQGLKDIELDEQLAPGRIRKEGGGRKKISTEPELPKVFAEVVEDYTAGKPQDDSVKWIGLTAEEIQGKLADRDYQVSPYIVRQLLSNAGLRRRSYLKDASAKEIPFRNEQFEKIAQLKASFLDAGLPVFSVDVKHKELLGNFYRDGKYYDCKYRKVNDHDFRSLANGIVIPHGIYDIADNFGYLTLGTSKDTSEFFCDNLAAYWQSDFQWKYPSADWMLLLCDGGGSNSARHYIVKQDLYHLAQRLDMNIVMAHYPPYCSKWNPIEHRLFCHVHRAWKGTIFHNIQIVKERAELTSTKTGLGVKVTINNKEYLTKRKVNPFFKKNILDFVTFDEQLPKWNYRFRPNR